MKTVFYILIATALSAFGWSLGLAIGNPPDKLGPRVKAEKPPKVLGPEWKKEGTLLTRTMEIPLGRQANGTPGWTWYTVDMENNTAEITERDDKRGVEISSSPRGKLGAKYMSVDAPMDEEGNIKEFKVVLKEVLYFDLDGDGMIDAMVDNRGNSSVPMVLFENQFVRVEDSKLGFGGVPKGETASKWGIGRKVQYRFVGNAWVAVPH